MKNRFEVRYDEKHNTWKVVDSYPLGIHDAIVFCHAHKKERAEMIAQALIALNETALSDAQSVKLGEIQESVNNALSDYFTHDDLQLTLDMQGRPRALLTLAFSSHTIITLRFNLDTGLLIYSEFSGEAHEITGENIWRCIAFELMSSELVSGIKPF